MSYCNRASCLAHRRPMYWNLQDRAWVHTDGWPCDGAAELAERAERQAAADQAFYDEGPRELAAPEDQAAAPVVNLCAALATFYEPCPVCNAPLSQHVARRACLPPRPAGKPRGIYDLPIFAWAWRDEGDQ